MPDLLARGDQGLDRLGRGADSRAHQHQHPLGVGGADVVDEAVPATGALAQLVHHLLHGGRDGVVERVGRLAGLEEHVGVLGAASQHRSVGAQPAQAVGEDVVLADQRVEVGVVERPRSCRSRGWCGTRRRSAGTAPGCAASRRGPRARSRGPPAPTTRTAWPSRSGGRPSRRCGRRRSRGAWVAMRPRRDVDDHRRQLAGHLVHVRDHQQQALGRGERRGERALLRRAVQRAARHRPRTASRPPRAPCPTGWGARPTTRRRPTLPSATPE